MSFANSSGVTVLLRFFFSSLVLTLSLSFSVFARNFDPTEYDAVPDTNPDYIKQLSNNEYDGTNTIGLLNQRVEIHYKMETINGVPVLTPYYTYSAKNFDLDNNTFNEMNSITPEGNINYDIDNSTFNGTDNGNWIDGSTLNGNSGEIVIDTSSFNTYNNISSKPFEYSSVADGSVGTQINSSTFNDHTDLTVENGGILEINDSTFNLASSELMQPLYTVLDSIYQVCINFFFSIRDYSSSSPTVTIAYPISGGSFVVNLPYYQFTSIVYDNFYLNTQSVSGYGGLLAQLRLFFRDVFPTYVTAPFQFLYNVFYPLNPDVYAWQFYNTDTGQLETTNLGGLMYNISWYLGQMFLMNTWEAGSELETPIEDLNNAFTDLDNAEDSLWSPVEDAFNSFAPDSGDITALSALGWVGNYLQQIFVNLGSFNIVITLSLILGVCMQFIGYFKYKNG